MTRVLRRLYAPEYLVKPSLVRGELPTTKQGYLTVMDTAWASIAEAFLIALISMADTMMVGAVGAHAIAAVGLVTQPRYLALALVMSLNIAVTAITARRKGENNPDGAVRCLKQALLFSLALSILPAAAASAGATPLLRFIGAQDDTLVLARDYLRIIMPGIPISCLSMTISAAKRGVGETRASMVINMSANIVNLLFNWLLIGGRLGFPALGVRGAAIATVIGWTVGLVIAVLSVADHRGFLHLFSRGVGWAPDRETARALYRVGSGSFLEQLCLRVGFLVYAKLVAGLGTVLFAAHQVCFNILSLSFSLGDGFGVASASLVGRSLGAQRPDLSILYGRICQRMSFLANIVIFFTFIFAGEYLVLLFTDDVRMIEVSRPIFWIMGAITFAQCSQMIYMGSLRGAGDTRYTAAISMICIMLLRPPLAWLLAYRLEWGLTGAWLALIADQYIRLIFCGRRFSSGKWMRIRL